VDAPTIVGPPLAGCGGVLGLAGRKSGAPGINFCQPTVFNLGVSLDSRPLRSRPGTEYIYEVIDPPSLRQSSDGVKFSGNISSRFPCPAGINAVPRDLHLVERTV
jgi:hypothetical protein